MNGPSEQPRSSRPARLVEPDRRQGKPQAIVGSLPALERVHAAGLEPGLDRSSRTALARAHDSIPQVRPPERDDGTGLSGLFGFVSLCRDGWNNLCNGHVLRGLAQMTIGGVSAPFSAAGGLILIPAIICCSSQEAALLSIVSGLGIVIVPSAVVGGLLYGAGEGLSAAGRLIPNPPARDGSTPEPVNGCGVTHRK